MRLTQASGTGGALMSKFVGVFKELGSYSELLRTQVEVILCERLQHSWVKVRLRHLMQQKENRILEAVFVLVQ